MHMTKFDIRRVSTIVTDYKIQILLSTYNGEKYLREQLNSYLSLDDHSNIKVLIRDDGSTDGTLAILREYEENFGFEIITGENLGLNASMYELLKRRDRNCDYYAFSDQDDVWLPFKIIRAVSSLFKNDLNSPALYSACSYITDEELNIKGHTIKAKRKLSFYNAMIQNICPGHSQVCNRSFIDILAETYSEDMMVFDYWAYLLASAVGNVIFDNEPTTLYRQHSSNAIGCDHSRFKTLKMRMNRVKTKISVQNAVQLKALCECASEFIAKEYKDEADDFFRSQKNFFTRLGYLCRSKAYRQTKIETLIFRLMYLFGRYNIK